MENIFWPLPVALVCLIWKSEIKSASFDFSRILSLKILIAYWPQYSTG